MQSLVLVSHDGTKLAARVFEPPSAPKGSVVIGGAMGVRQEFYAPFADWLAAKPCGRSRRAASRSRARRRRSAAKT